MIQRIAATAAAALALLSLVGCVSTSTAPPTAIGSTVSPTPSLEPVIPSEWALAHAKAETLLATATLPGDAVRTTAAPSSAPGAPFDRLACKPTVDVTSYALMRNVSVQQAQSEVAATVKGGAPSSGKITKGGAWISAGVSEPAPDPRSELTVTLAPTADGDVAVRVDAVVEERDATCVTHGIPVHGSPAPTPTP